ncbi:hypothetical protein VTI74DRAFT_8295 [Chaetomium olivicolor]
MASSADMEPVGSGKVAAAAEKPENTHPSRDPPAVTATSYRSPPRSSIPPFIQSCFQLQTPPASEGKGKKKRWAAADERRSCAATTKHIANLPSSSGGSGGSGGNGGVIPSVGSPDSPTSESSPDNFEQDEQMRLLRQGFDPNEPQALGELRQVYKGVQSFGNDRCNGMLIKELRPIGPKGSILADEMGLGKSGAVSRLHVTDPPEKKPKATKILIIALKRLLLQWYHKIKRHCADRNARRISLFAAETTIDDDHWQKSWALTGTPMANNTGEFFLYLDFLRTK